MNNSDTAVNIMPDDSVSNAPAARVATVIPKLTRAQQIAKIEEEMSNDERSTYLDARDMDQDFYNVEQ